MEIILDSRQAQQQQQFPASFPDVFKKYFESMNVEEDHVDLYSNLLEDKVIPRSCHNQELANRRSRSNGRRGNSFSGPASSTSADGFGDSLRTHRNHSCSGNDVSLLGRDALTWVSPTGPGAPSNHRHWTRIYSVTNEGVNSSRNNRSRSCTRNVGRSTSTPTVCRTCEDIKSKRSIGSTLNTSDNTGRCNRDHLELCLVGHCWQHGIYDERQKTDCKRSQSAHSSPHKMKNQNDSNDGPPRNRPLQANIQNFVDYCSGYIFGVGVVVVETEPHLGPVGADNKKSVATSSAKKNTAGNIRFQLSQLKPQERRHSDLDHNDDMSFPMSTFTSSHSRAPPLGSVSAGATPTHGRMQRHNLREGQQQQNHQQLYEQDLFALELTDEELYTPSDDIFYEQLQDLDDAFSLETFNHERINDYVSVCQQPQQENAMAKNQANVMAQEQPNVMAQQQTNVMEQQQPNMMGQQQHNIMGQQQHNIMEQQQPNMMGQQQHNIMGQQQHNIMGQQQHNIMEQQQPNMMGQQQHNIMGQQQPNIMGQQQPIMIGQQQPNIMGQQQPIMIGQQQPLMMGLQQSNIIGQQQANIMGQQQPILMGQQQPILIGLQQPNVIGLQQPNIIGLQQPIVMALQQPLLMGIQQPNIMAQQQPNMMGQQQPNIMGKHQPKRLLPIPPIKPIANQQRITQQRDVGTYFTGPSTSAAAASASASASVNRNDHNYAKQNYDNNPINPAPRMYMSDQESDYSYENNTWGLRRAPSPTYNRHRSSSVATYRLQPEFDAYRRGSSGSNQNDNRGLPGGNKGGAIGSVWPTSTAFVSARRGSIPGMARRCSPPLQMESGVLTMQQALSGAVSPQYSIGSGDGLGINVTHNIMGLGGASSMSALTSLMDDGFTSGPDPNNSPTYGNTPTSDDSHPIPGLSSSMCSLKRGRRMRERRIGEAADNSTMKNPKPKQSRNPRKHHYYLGNPMYFGGRQPQRMRTSSMPAENRRPLLADTRRGPLYARDVDMGYYSLRSFSVTSTGACDLGNSLNSRMSRSVNSLRSTGAASNKARHNSNASGGHAKTEGTNAAANTNLADPVSPTYKVAMLGAPTVGKTTLTYQFSSSEYICGYDMSLDDKYGQKTVSVRVNTIETDVEIIDHPAREMSTEAFCSTYDLDLFVVVYSVCDRNSFKVAENALQYLKENDMLMTRGAILVGNKNELQRNRVVTQKMGETLASQIPCKFIETSAGINHNINELLVGIIAQVKLNPERINRLSDEQRQRLNQQNHIQKHRRGLPPHRIVRQNSMSQHDADGDEAAAQAAANAAAAASLTSGSSLTNDPNKIFARISAKIYRRGVLRKIRRRPLNLESILKLGESEIEDDDEIQSLRQQGYRPMSKFEQLTTGRRPDFIHGGVSFTRANSDEQQQGNLNSNETNGGQPRPVISLSSRTRAFLRSVIRFRRTLFQRHRKIWNCKDLFVI